MRKKLAALLPLYLAGMILLAFAVFPHHHHENYICFNTTHCQAESGKNTDDHRNGPFSEKSHCIHWLFQTQLNNNPARNLTDDDHTPMPSSHLPFLYCMLSEIVGILSYETNFLTFPAAQNEKLHAFLLAFSRDTRAPPVC